MNDARHKIALRWLYSNCGRKWFTPLVLDSVANAAGNPPKEIQPTEVHSIFEDLRKLDYILPVVNERGVGCYILNECREKEWLEKIDKLAPSPEKRVRDFLEGQAASIASGFVAGLIGALAVALVEKLTK